MIDNEQILKLAEQYFSFVTEYTTTGWVADTEDLLKFAEAMYDRGRDDEAEHYVDENY